eukprot:GEMP01075998.1.p1 GENE.GEMP01075998.1~~GEMP01075998.1.p1  ORF type:complete len:195 (+),score=16.12 GEMP01075998.1:126-710(+)
MINSNKYTRSTWYADDTRGVHWLDHTMYDKLPDCIKACTPHAWLLIHRAEPLWMIRIRCGYALLAVAGFATMMCALFSIENRTDALQGSTLAILLFGFLLVLAGSIGDTVTMCCCYADYMALWSRLFCLTCSRFDEGKIQEWEERIWELNNRHRVGKDPLPFPKRTISCCMSTEDFVPIGFCNNENTDEYGGKA